MCIYGTFLILLSDVVKKSLRKQQLLSVFRKGRIKKKTLTDKGKEF